jgi:eukaryotic-like serine/threonine-protein kinase
VPLDSGIQIVGRFEIVAPLGAGSMGEVYQAHDLKLRRDVALKLLSPALATSQEYLLRFEREARAASALNHPHICTIYDVGQAPEADNRPYLVMELLRGLTLFEVLASGPLSVSTVIGLGVQIADALDVAHNAGIIHRDLKPANIFVTARGDAKLLDFGLAAMAGVIEGAAAPAGMEDVRHPTVLTNPGTAVGTVLYMSPEQALGDPLDNRTDLFSLGLVLYEMLTGRRAFEGRSTTAIVDAILHVSPAGLNPADTSNVPKDLRRLLMRLLDKDRDRRPATAAEVAAHLRAVQSGSIAGREYAAALGSGSGSSGLKVASDIYDKAPIFHPADGSSGLTRIFASDSMKEAGLIVTVLLLLAAGAYGGVSWYRGRVVPPAAREPLLLGDFTNTTGEAVFDGALKDALEIQLQQSPYVKVLPTSQVRSTLQLMERSPNEPLTAAVAQDLCERLGVKAILLGSIAPLSSAYVITLEAQACHTGDTLARDQVQASSKTDVLATVGTAAARIRERLGESIGSIQRFNVAAPNATTPSLEALKAYSMGIETRITTGDVQAIPFFEHALELDPNFALAAARLSSIYTNLRELDPAQTYIKRAFARSDSLSEPERLFIRSQYHYIVTGRLEDVVATYRLWTATYPDDWVPHNNLSTAYLRLGQPENARREADLAVRLGGNSVVPYQQMTRSLLALNRITEAQDMIRDATSKNLESSSLHALAFDLAFITHDPAGMQENLRAAAARADGYLAVIEAARAALASGELVRSRALFSQAIAAAQGAHMSDYAGGLLAEQALGDALVLEVDRARGEWRAAMNVSHGPETTWTASMAAAFSGESARAGELAAAFHPPPAPDVIAVQTPMLQAAISLAEKQPRRAMTDMAAATPLELAAGPWLPYINGLAAADQQDPVHAAQYFRSLIARPGDQPTSLLHTLAQLQLARAERDAGNVGASRQAYADFSSAWRNADAKQPLLVAATREAADLPAPSTTSAQR